MPVQSIDRRRWLRSVGASLAAGSLSLVFPGCGQPYATNSLGMQFVRIPRGAFTMGAPESEVGHAFTESGTTRVVENHRRLLSTPSIGSRRMSFVSGLPTDPPKRMRAMTIVYPRKRNGSMPAEQEATPLTPSRH
jgi:hypothetical protein